MAFGEVYLDVQTLPQGLKPDTSFAVRAARLKPCPFKAVHFSGVY
jgi:hypothetical protein